MITRLTDGTHIVAVNFGDLRNLEHHTHLVLHDLRYIVPLAANMLVLTFTFQKGQQSFLMNWEIEGGTSRGLNLFPSKGVSARDWVELLIARLENLLLV